MLVEDVVLALKDRYLVVVFAFLSGSEVLCLLVRLFVVDEIVKPRLRVSNISCIFTTTEGYGRVFVYC